MLDCSPYRDLFPITRTQVFFNHAAIAAPSTRVIEAMADFMREHACSGAAGYRAWMKLLRKVRVQLADFIGTEPGSIAFVPNTSSGLSLVAEGFPWRAGDAVLMPVPDFPANLYPWLHLRRRGVEVIEVPRHGGRVTVEDFERALLPQARMLVLSSVDYASGFAADLDAVGRFCREKGLVFGVDAIQSLGVLPLDLQRTPVDFLSAGAHKWLLGPMGIGLLYVAPELRTQLAPPLVGWKSVEDEEDFTCHFRLRGDAAQFEPGTLNLAGIAGLGAALALLEEVGIEVVCARVLALVTSLTDGLRTRPHLEVSGGTGTDCSGILSFRPPGDPQQLFRELTRAGVGLALRDGRLRLSPHFYNNADDVAQFFAALDRCLS